MKRFSFLATIVALTSLFIASCEKDDNEPETTAEGIVSAFFPTGYGDKTVAAWYTSTEHKTKEGYDTESVTAVYLFTDNTYLVTYSKVAEYKETKEIEVRDKKISATGNYEFKSGDYTNGEAIVYIDGQPNELNIAGGQFTIMGETFAKQDNKKVPAASEGTEDNSGNNQSGDNNQPGGDKTGLPETLEAFFPSAYKTSGVVAWYSYTNVENDRIKTMAVFLFSDNTVVVTKNKLKADGSAEKEIEFEGTFSITKGDYTNGTVNVGGQFDAFITDGVLSVPAMGDETFTIQDINNIPAPSEATGNNSGNNQSGDNKDDNQSGDNNGDNNQSGGEETGLPKTLEAFFPSAYSSKTVAAWYSYTNIEKDRIKTQAVFLFTDNTVVVTKHKVKADGSVEKEIDFEGTYTITEGDYTNGKANVSDMFEAVISDGLLTVMTGEPESFTKQDNSAVPAASNATN
ncbi:MAG: hypothetical protein J6U13_03960 [Salinivirgaceae bacterium]|nr:hypothetical protein [Salinivirgaceae bacterium]